MRRLLFPLAVLHGRGESFAYVEIGTADFDTLAQRLQDVDVRGLSVEPVEEHLRRLPDHPKKEKVAAAIAEEDGWADLYIVRPEYMEPQCSNETVASLGLRYCLPWWFRATASLRRPSALVEVHAAEKASEAQAVVKVQTLTYRSLLERYNVTSLQLLKIDTEGLDTLILRQMLRYGEEFGLFPERVQFERNNLTDASASQQTYNALQAAYDCWVPPTEDDVHCLRLGNIAAGRPTASSGEDADPPWIRVELPERLAVAGVRVATDFPQQLEATVGESWDPSLQRRCGTLLPVVGGGAAAAAARCPPGVEGRYVVLRGPTAVSSTPQVLATVTSTGAFRMAAGRSCCHRGCQMPDLALFEGYDGDCEARCRADSRCHFFSSYSSLWCTTYADCDEEIPSTATVLRVGDAFASEFFGEAATFGLASLNYTPLALVAARQSSEDWGGEAERAVDGLSETHFLRGSCSHTAGGGEEDPRGAWWVAETAQPDRAIAAVRILGRWDCCNERLNNWEVRVGQSPDPWENPRCGSRQGMLQPGGRRLIRCGGEVDFMHGKFVGVVLPGGEPLTLCEVEAFTIRVL